MFWRLRSLMLGIVLGLLLSPGTGMENRRRFWLWLQGKAGEAAPKVQMHVQQMATKGATVASQTLDQARQQVAPITQRAQETISSAGQTAQEKIEQATRQMTSRSSGAATSGGSAPASSTTAPSTPAPTPVPTVSAPDQNTAAAVREVDGADSRAEPP